MNKPLPDSAIDSVNFWPYWTGENKTPPRKNAPGRSSNAIFSIREGKWKFIEHDPENPTKRYAENRDQLYDLDNDPGELNNLLSEYPEIVERLKKELSKVKP